MASAWDNGARQVCRHFLASQLVIEALLPVLPVSAQERPLPEPGSPLVVEPPQKASPPAPTTSLIEVEESRPSQPEPSQPTTTSRTLLSLPALWLEPRGLDEAIQQVPGVAVQRLGGPGRSSSLLIRGASAAHTQVFVDGVPLSHPASGAVNLEDLPLESVEGLELYRGGSPLAFGADAPGGVLNLLTGPAPPGVTLQARLAIGSWGYRRASAGWQLGLEDGALRLQLGALSDRGDHPFFFNGGTDYATYDDQVIELANHDVTRVEATARAEKRFQTDWTLTVQGSQLSKAQGVLGLGQGVLVTHARYQLDQSQGYLRLGRPLDGLYGAPLHLETTLDGLWRREDFSDPYGEVALIPQRTLLQSQALGVQTRLSGPLTPQLALDLVGLVRSEGAANVRSQETWGRLRAGTGVQLELYLGRAVGMTSLLLDHLSPHDGKTPSQTLLSPRAGLELALGALTLRTNGGAFHRAPTFSELYGNQGNVVGNPELRPELGRNLDLGLTLDPVLPGAALSMLSGARLELSAFASRQEDLIVYVQNSQGTVRPENLAAGDILGLEGGLRVSWQALVSLQAAYTWLRALDRSGIPAQEGQQLPGRPRHALHAALRLGPERFSVTASADVQSEVALEPSHTLMAPARALLDVGVQARLDALRWDGQWLEQVGLDAEGLRGFKVYAEVRNLLDVIQVQVEGIPSPQPLVDVLGFPLPGRTFILGVRWEG